MGYEIELDKITSEVSRRLQETLGDKLRQVILYGSYARGDYEEYSDVDIMVLMDIEENEIMDIRKKTVRISSDLGLEHDVLISMMIKNHDFFYSWSDAMPFYRNVLKDGVFLYG